MWLSDRRHVLALAAAGLVAACGFTPGYGPGGSADRLYGRVSIAEPQDQETYILVRELEHRLGRGSIPEYDMIFSLRTNTEGQAITAEGNITRFSIVGIADFQLKPRGEDTVLAEGSARNFVGYSATGTTVETLAAERDAFERLMIILADQIVAQLYATAELPE
ncbi:MAG: LPS assembly lipoprotein LptE [Paracoccaceae bacterium]